MMPSILNGVVSFELRQRRTDAARRRRDRIVFDQHFARRTDHPRNRSFRLDAAEFQLEAAAAVDHRIFLAQRIEQIEQFFRRLIAPPHQFGNLTHAD